MIPIKLPVLGNLASRLLIEVLVRVAWVKELFMTFRCQFRGAAPPR